MQAKKHGINVSDANYRPAVPGNSYVKTPSPTHHQQIYTENGKVSFIDISKVFRKN